MNSGSLYKRGLGQGQNQLIPVTTLAPYVGADSPAPGLASIGVVALGAFAIWWLATRKSKSSGPDMSDVNAKLRAKGKNPRTYGF